MKIRGDAVAVDGKRKLERAAEAAVATFDTVVLLVWYVTFGPVTGNREVAIVDLDVNVAASETGQLRRDHVLLDGFVDVNRRNPA
jgi:hypothetical protein